MDDFLADITDDMIECTIINKSSEVKENERFFEAIARRYLKEDSRTI
jgi:hypothetical protein